MVFLRFMAGCSMVGHGVLLPAIMKRIIFSLNLMSLVFTILLFMHVHLFHRIDRMVLYRVESVTQREARDLSNQESLCKNEIMTLSFVVGNGQTGLPNAYIQFNGQTYRTNEEGRATITVGAGGDYHYEVSLDGYEGMEGKVSISQSTTAMVSLTEMTTSVDAFIPLGAVAIYPNPANTYLTVVVQNWVNPIWTIYNTNGQELGTGIFQADRAIIATEYLTDGIYVVEVASKQGVTKQQVVIQH